MTAAYDELLGELRPAAFAMAYRALRSARFGRGASSTSASGSRSRS